MPDRVHQFRPDDVAVTRGPGKRGPLADVVLDRGLIQFSRSSAGAIGDAATARPYDQINAVFEGVMHFTIDGVDYQVGPGQAIYIPPGAVRIAGSVTDTHKIEIFGTRFFERWEFARHQLAREQRS